ncbi:MAG: hypothetical protein A2504_12380 [Bdellovibrionales bacterium RIFOXYD12_FULL_39_22]|nr:MAG: hypothetical protein A2385_17915 [Bdellovibrionales bacterium RIFOXYB1_FULL_39_21]OFZ40704.1 MAG: hypothetical protein A2485_03690 [Bdellovibrionales bacterium RIFOXYC12_FULL_39_17]OFZ49745.1 MAG: hypothetical protein A2404_00045 [Bdellovibrionales bacterium RIFOXYC1_FULL_39_130]OFZ77279.1 MAG: hypothetical protein A2560_14875 [Bdellovibrionales bacterium RIFOXYD1_FULL_39_84]OFZ91826.1 MAG: hypothetical protein A2504_12380 [Bdellovibrionales bacterium RIFOXYD12_FULL_39_22]
MDFQLSNQFDKNDAHVSMLNFKLIQPEFFMFAGNGWKFTLVPRIVFLTSLILLTSCLPKSVLNIPSSEPTPSIESTPKVAATDLAATPTPTQTPIPTVTVPSTTTDNITKLFSEDFENGLKKLTTFGDVTIVSGCGISGSQCLRANYGTDKNLGSIIDLGANAPTDQFYVRFNIKIDANYHAPYLGFKWMRLKHGNVDGIQSEFFLNSDSWYSTGHTYETGAGGVDYPDTNHTWYPTFQDGQWHQVEVYGKYNTAGQANGICIIKFDGVIYLNEETYRWRTSAWSTDIFKRFYIPSNAGDGAHLSAAGDIVYIDNIEIWNGWPPVATTSATRLMYENFDDQVINPSMSVYGAYGATGYVLQLPPQYNLDQVGRGGSGFAFSSGTVNQAWPSWDKNLPNPWPSDEMYVSFWIRYPTFTSTDTMENFKVFYPHWNGADSYAHFSMGDTNTIYYSAKGNGTMLSISNYLSCPNQTDGNWHHYEFFVKFSTGISRFWYDGILKLNHNYGSGVWTPNPISYIAAPMIDGEEPGTFSRQVDDWEAWDSMPPIQQAAKLLIFDNFETGPNWKYSDNWDLWETYYQSKWNITTNSPHSGLYAAEAMAKDTTGNLAINSPCFHFSVTTNGVFVKLWAKFLPNINSNNVRANFFRYGTGAAGDWTNGGEFDIQDNWLYFYDDKVRNPKINIQNDGQWHEYAFFLDYKNGIWRSWLDSGPNYTVATTIDNFTDMKFTKPFTHILMPYYWKADPGEYHWWIDDIEVWDGPPLSPI